MLRQQSSPPTHGPVCVTCGGVKPDERLGGCCPKCLLVLALPPEAREQETNLRTGAGAAPASFLSPRRLGRYEILEELGRGEREMGETLKNLRRSRR